MRIPERTQDGGKEMAGETEMNAVRGEMTAGNKRNAAIAEWTVFALLAVSYAAIACFHEPWFGEAEAWQIAKCASLKDILFHIPHYEGHPPLWHLMLAVPAKLGLPYELSLKAVAGAATLCSGWLILFRSPFPKPVRLVLPFHYFFFYQYGIVARPYGYVVLCLLLMALTFREKDRRPWRFVLSMLFLCLFSAYGIVLAGGVCMVWVWEIAQEKGWRLFSADFWRDKRVIPMLMLLAAAILLILEILPRSDTYATVGREGNSILTRLLYTFFAMLPDSTVITLLQGEHFLKYSAFSALGLGMGVALGILMLLALASVSSGKNLRYFLIPYALFAAFSAVVYFNAHHMGLGLSFAIFWLWTALEDSGRFGLWEKAKSGWKPRVKISDQDRRKLKNAGMFVGALLLAVPVFWTLMSSLQDIREPYFFGRDTAAFIREKGLEELSIMADWDVTKPKEGEEADWDAYENMDTNLINLPVSILPYIENMTVWNMKMGDPTKGYVEHRIASAQENKETVAKWQEHEIPEMLIGNVDLEFVYGKEIAGQYVQVYRIWPIYANIWKGYLQEANRMDCSFIYLRKDLLDKYGLEPISAVPF